MYLNEVTLLSFIALALLLLNLAFKYYYIFKRGYSISNLVLIKLGNRILTILTFTILIYLGIENKNHSFKSPVNTVEYILPIKSFNSIVNLETATIIKFSEQVNIQKEEKGSLIIHISDTNLYYLAIPSTSKITLLNLLQSSNLHFDLSTLKMLDKTNVNVNPKIQPLDLSMDNDQMRNISKNEYFQFVKYLNYWFESRYIQVYLLILAIFFISFDLFSKFRIIKT